MTFHDRLNVFWAAVIKACYAIAGIILVLMALLLATRALAQPAGALVDDPVKAVTSIMESVARGQWWMVAAGVMSILTWGFRSGILLKLPSTGALSFLGRAGTWLVTNPVSSLMTPFVLSAVLALVTTFSNGTPFTWQTLVQEVLKIGAGAVAVFIASQKIQEAVNAGKLAAAGITTQQQALDELAKRVIKGEPTTPVPPGVPPVA